MLRWASRGVAMGHADDVTRAAADEVTGSWEDGGALAVLRDLLTL
jgi:hydroxymethylpyrimidine pyrophosphatase-like HAD family hydrolase